MKRFFITKEQVVLFILSSAFALVLTNNIFHLRDILGSSAPYIISGVLGSVLGFLLFRAGLIVIKSLMFVAAELSLLIFLAQSYCGTDVIRSQQSDSALSGLILLGLSYVGYRFLQDAFNELKSLIERFKEVDGRWSWEVVLMSFLLILFVGIFVWSVYLVINPIVGGLCVYRNH